MSGRIIYLEVNEAGSWKRITSFDLDTFEDGDLEYDAHNLLEMSANPKLKARLIMLGETAPLMNWTHVDGWREWRAAK